LGVLRCCFVYQIRNGKIASLHSYYDMMTMLEQLGLVPATEQATQWPLKPASIAEWGTRWGTPAACFLLAVRVLFL